MHEQKRAKTLSAPFSATNMLKVTVKKKKKGKERKKRKLGYAQWQLAKFAIQPLGGVSKEEQVSIKKRKKNTAKGFSRS